MLLLIHEKEKTLDFFFLLSSSRANPNAWIPLDHFVYEDLFSWFSKVHHVSSLIAFLFFLFILIRWWMLWDGEASEKLPDMRISAYQCREPLQTTLPDKWPLSWPSLCMGRGHEIFFCCLFSIEIALSSFAVKRDANWEAVVFFPSSCLFRGNNVNSVEASVA